MLQARSHLFCAWRSEYSAGDASGEQTVAYEAGESGFMARTTATDDGNVVRLGERRGVAVDNFVWGVEQKRRIGKGKGVERGKDSVGRIIEVVLCCWGEMSAPGHLG